MVDPVASLGRLVARAWRYSGKAPGLYYRAVESVGHRLAAAPVPVRLVNGLQIDCDLNDHVQRQIYFLGLYEPVESYLFVNLIEPGMTVIDAGANVGQYTLLASTSVGAAGTVHSFEPVPGNFAKIQKNVARNACANVRLNQAALWKEQTSITLGIVPEAKGINNGSYTVAQQNSDRSFSVSAITLDDYAAEKNIGRVHFIKMDIEGAELFALQGMREVLRRDSPTLLMEINRPLWALLGYDPEQVWSMLADDLGYRAWIVGSSAETSRSISDLRDVVRGNVVFYKTDLTVRVTSGWELKSVLRWTRERGKPSAD